MGNVPDELNDINAQVGSGDESDGTLQRNPLAAAIIAAVLAGGLGAGGSGLWTDRSVGAALDDFKTEITKDLGGVTERLSSTTTRLETNAAEIDRMRNDLGSLTRDVTAGMGSVSELRRRIGELGEHLAEIDRRLREIERRQMTGEEIGEMRKQYDELRIWFRQTMQGLKR